MNRRNNMGFLLLQKKQMTLKQEIEKIIGEQEKQEHIPQKQGSTKWVLSFLLLVNGGSIGYLLKNEYLIFVLGGIFAFLPLLYYSLKREGDKEQKDWYLAAKTITAEYQSCLKIDTAIQNTLLFAPDSTQNILQRFLQRFQSSQSDALAYLKKKMPNENLQFWCDIVSISIENNQLISLLPDVLKKRMQLDYMETSYHDKRIHMAWAAIGILAFAVLVTGVLCFFGDSCKLLLVSERGKLFTSVMAGCTYICICKIAQKGGIT